MQFLYEKHCFFCVAFKNIIMTDQYRHQAAVRCTFITMYWSFDVCISERHRKTNHSTMYGRSVSEFLWIEDNFMHHAKKRMPGHISCSKSDRDDTMQRMDGMANERFFIRFVLFYSHRASLVLSTAVVFLVSSPCCGSEHVTHLSVYLFGWLFSICCSTHTCAFSIALRTSLKV